MEWLIIALLVVLGLMLIAIDFYLPGFVLGSIGTLLLIAALVVCKFAYGLTAALMLLPGLVVLGLAAGYISIKYIPETAAGRKLILAQTQSGVRAQTPRLTDWIGQEGVAQTVLRPSGMAMFDGKRLDVMAESGMIESGSRVRVITVENNNIIVRKI